MQHSKVGGCLSVVVYLVFAGLLSLALATAGRLLYRQVGADCTLALLISALVVFGVMYVKKRYT